MRLLRLLGTVTAVTWILECSGMGPSSTGKPPGNTNPGGNQSGSTLSLTVNDYFFQPAIDTVAVNTTVTWTWNSTVAIHNVTFQDGPFSNTQSSGTFQRTFATVGTYPYRCTIHSPGFTSGMVGTVVVK